MAAVIRQASLTFLLVGSFWAAITAQQPRLTFEVASIRPNNNSAAVPRPPRAQPGGLVTATNIPIASVILVAYQIERHQLIGGPGWIHSERFDIAARADREIPATPRGGGAGPLEVMLQSLLLDRFKLAVRWEEHELPIYALVRARSDGRFGPKLRRVDVNCQGDQQEAERTPLQLPKGRRCEFRYAPGLFRADGTSMRLFVELLRSPLGTERRPVIDETDLRGTYDIELTWTPMRVPQPSTLPPGAPPIPAVDPNGPDLFTAMQEQLGLRLEPRRAPTKVLVIESIEPPSDN
jgi:uncharacterized protein (TIGR03435 family)